MQNTCKWPEINVIWYVKYSGGLLFNLFKLGHCDLILRISDTMSEIILIWYVKCPGGLVSNLFKLGHCDPILRFYGMMFVKRIFDFLILINQYINFIAIIYHT